VTVSKEKKQLFLNSIQFSPLLLINDLFFSKKKVTLFYHSLKNINNRGCSTQMLSRNHLKEEYWLQILHEADSMEVGPSVSPHPPIYVLYEIHMKEQIFPEKEIDVGPSSKAYNYQLFDCTCYILERECHRRAIEEIPIELLRNSEGPDRRVTGAVWQSNATKSRVSSRMETKSVKREQKGRHSRQKNIRYVNRGPKMQHR
jgi:hypothetical protein